MMSGTVFSQIVTVAAAPVLSRLYTGEQFGILALYISISALFILIATGRYELAIVLPDEEKKAYNLVAVSSLIAAAMTLISYLTVLIFGDILSSMFKEPLLGKFLLFVPLSVLSMGLYQVFYNWSLRRKKFRIMSFSKIVQSAVTVAVSITMGFSGDVASGLIAGWIGGQIAAMAFIGISTLIKQPVAWSQIRYPEMKSVAIQYKDFPRVNAFHAMLDSVQNYGITFLISFAFGNTALGWYSFSYRILRTPLALIGSSFAQINYSTMSEMYNKGISIRPVVVQTMKRIFFIGIPFFAIAAVFSPYIFNVIFGSEWKQAGVLAQIMAPWLFINFIVSPASVVPNILNKQKKAFILNLSAAAFSLLILFASIALKQSFFVSFLFFSVASLLSQTYIGSWLLKISGTQMR